MANYNLTQTGDEVQAYIDSIPVIDVTGTLSGSNIVFATNPYSQIAANYADDCGSVLRLTVAGDVYVIRITGYDSTYYTGSVFKDNQYISVEIGESSAQGMIEDANAVALIPVTGTESGGSITLSSNPFTQVQTAVNAGQHVVVRVTYGSDIVDFTMNTYSASVATYIGTANFLQQEFQLICSASSAVITNRSTSNTFSTGESVPNVGIDATPTQGSDNLVKSGAVWEETNEGTQETIQPTQINNAFYNLLTRTLVGNNNYWYCIQDIPEHATKLKTRWEKSTGGGVGIEFRDADGNVTGTFSNTTLPAQSEIEIDIPSGSVVFTYSYQKSYAFNGFTFTIVTNKFDVINKELHETASVVVYPTQINNYYYNLLTRTLINNGNYWYCIQDIPQSAIKLKTRWEKSTGGGVGIEFRDADGNVTGTFSNTTLPAQSEIEIDIPSGSVVFTYSYQKSYIFVGFIFTQESIMGRIDSAEDRLNNIESDTNGINAPQIPVYGAAKLYLSNPTPNIAEDSLTLSELYEGYDTACADYPQWIERLTDLGTDADGNAIRLYRVGYKNPLMISGEANIIKSESATPTNIFDNATMRFRKILVNTGTHGDEKAPCWSVMLAITELVGSQEPWALYIKSSFNIYVCPTLNPYGFANRTRANANGVDINRDIDAQTQPESQAWKTWIDANTDAIGYLDIHGCDYFYPFFEIPTATSAELIKKYNEIATQLAGAFFKNWNSIYGTRNFPRPYVVKSTYSGMTIDYASSVGVKGFIVETPCDIVNNQYNPAPNYFKSFGMSNKMTKDMLLNLIQYFGDML